ncbi:hypothetical protein J437_LFUL009004 [Ladona fulva]|uniref:Nose resistant to fluoxetine protein 6-like n=1 Tax=Ladona fulva TaxID=123851 RepID=A0A8K0P0I7_LADFU|nr:hypothetical protein J437_LFUL009004 [Ladona fulva]
MASSFTSPLLVVFLLPYLLYGQQLHGPASLVALAPPSLGLEGSLAGGARYTTSSPVLFSSALPPFAPISPRVPGERCRSDSQLMLKELKALTLWAVEMFDASAKFPTGLLHGSTLEAGNFDESLDLQYHLQHALEPYAQAIGGDSVIGTNIDDDNGPVFSIRVDEKECQRSDTDGPNAPMKPISVGEIVVGTLFLIVFLLVLMGTSYDIFMRAFFDGVPELNKQGPLEKYVMCFSAYANGIKIMEEDSSDNPLQFLNGVKFYSICLIIMGHRIFYSLGGPIMNTHYVEQFYSSFEVVFLLGGPVVVDTFFTISGCLLCFILLTEYQKHKSRISLSILYINRFIRLTPLYMAIVGLYATLMPRIASGPIWPSKILLESERCANNWWTNLLYINSFVEKKEMCMLQSWYLSSDMQLFIIGAPIALLIAKRPKFGKALLTLFLIVAAIIPFVLTFIHNWEPIFPVYMDTVSNLLASDTYTSTYVPTYMRAAPYFIGMWVGCIIYDHRARQVTMSLPTAVIGYIVCTVAMIGPILGSWTFYSTSWEYNPISSAVYASLHRLSWAGGIGWGIYALTTEYSWLFGRFFGWKRVYPLGRLTYSAFLVHCGLQLIDVGSQRSPLYISIYSMNLSVMADTLLSFLLGFFMSLLFEAPVLSLQRVLLSSRLKNKEDDAMVEEVKIGKSTPETPPPPYSSQHDNPAWVEDESQDAHL